MASGSIVDDAIARFLREPVTYVVASRDRDNLPSLGYACGTRPVRTGGTVTLFLPPIRCSRLIDDLAATGAIALCICRPTTLRTLQIKGTDARVASLADTDAVELERYRALIADELERVGDAREWTDTHFPGASEEMVAVTFTPTSCFVQTPGPDAGRVLKP